MLETRAAEWRNWQTHQTQNLAPFTGREGSTPSSATTQLKPCGDAQVSRFARLVLPDAALFTVGERPLRARRIGLRRLSYRKVAHDFHSRHCRRCNRARGGSGGQGPDHGCARCRGGDSPRFRRHRRSVRFPPWPRDAWAPRRHALAAVCGRRRLGDCRAAAREVPVARQLARRARSFCRNGFARRSGRVHERGRGSGFLRAVRFRALLLPGDARTRLATASQSPFQRARSHRNAERNGLGLVAGRSGRAVFLVF